MPQARSNFIDIAYEVEGPENGTPLLLIQGLGMQLIRWPQALRDAFVAAGFRVIRFDNRDAGLSTHLDGVAVPNLAEVTAAKLRGDAPDLPYSLSDMANDTAGLLGALNIERAHVLGLSFGGLVAQTLAIEHPDRVLSLTIMMCQSGNPALPPADPELLTVLAGPEPDPATHHEAYLRHSVAFNRALAGPGYPPDETELRDLAARSAARTYDPDGKARQLAAARGSPDLRPALRLLDVPTLVIHGAHDRLMLPVCGEDIARNVKDAWLLIVNGMGHDLPRPLFDLFVGAASLNGARALAQPPPF